MTELIYLLLTAMFTSVLWFPVVIGYGTARGVPKPADYKVAPITPLPAWVNRANRAHANAIENLVPFAVVVLIAAVAGVSTHVTAVCAAIYFYARVAHAVVHISGISLLMARTLIFMVAWAAFAVYAVVILQHLVALA